MDNFNQQSSETLFSEIYTIYEKKFSDDLSDLESHFKPLKVKQFLKAVFFFNKDSMLSYTSSPQSPLNQRIISLAKRLACVKKMHPICLLMPKISTKCLKRSEESKEGTAIYSNLNALDLSLETILSEYISGDSGTNYLIPVKVLAECRIQDVTNKINNYYYDISLPEEKRGTGYLTDSEIYRLYHFSTQTHQLWELRKNYSDLLKSDLSLLDQLNIFLKNIGFISKSYGKSSNLDSGSGSYWALTRFLEYYNLLNEELNSKIPKEIREEIHLLMGLPFDATFNTNSRIEVQTYMNFKYDKLRSLVHDHKEVLSSIHLKKELSKETLLLKIEEDYKKTQNDLVANFQEGHDPLGISYTLLETFQDNITVHSERDLHLFLVSCPANEYARILNPQSSNKSFRNSILNVFRNYSLDYLIPRLVILLLELEPEKGKAFLELFPEIIDALKKITMAFSKILLSFEGKKFQSIVAGLSPDLLIYYLRHPEELEDSSVFSEEKRVWIQNETEKLADWIGDFSSFMKIILDIEDREKNIEFIKKVGFKKLVSFVKNIYSFKSIFWRVRDENQKRQFIEAVGFSKLASFVTDTQSFKDISCNLRDENQNRQFVEAVGFWRLLDLVRDKGSFTDIAWNFRDESQKQKFIEEVGFWRLVSFTRDRDSFTDIVSNLSDEGQRRQFIKEVGFWRLVSFTRDRDSFTDIVSNLSDEEQRRQFIEEVGFLKIASFVTDKQSFIDIASNIKNEIQNRQFIEVMNFEKLSSFVSEHSVRVFK